MRTTKNMIFRVAICCAFVAAMRCDNDDLADSLIKTAAADESFETATVGGLKWTSNLNIKTSDGSWCYDKYDEDSSFYCAFFGRLYDWATAQKICPSGWRLPSSTEWSKLTYEDIVWGGYKDKSSYGGYDGGGIVASYWTSSGSHMDMHDLDKKKWVENDFYGVEAASVRCVKK